LPVVKPAGRVTPCDPLVPTSVHQWLLKMIHHQRPFKSLG
jgi:hypothetical protein